jgi:hypothetical protein
MTDFAYNAGFSAKAEEIFEMGFEAARAKFNIDNPIAGCYASKAGEMYARGERDALLEYADGTLQEIREETDALDEHLDALAAATQADIAKLINQMVTAIQMESVKDEEGRRVYDFWLWHTDRCNAVVRLADEHGIELPELGLDRRYLADYPRNPKYEA